MLILSLAGSAMAMPGDIELWNENFVNRIDGTNAPVQLKPGETITISARINYLDDSTATPNEVGTYQYDVKIIECGGGAVPGDFSLVNKTSFTLPDGGSPYDDSGVVQVTLTNTNLPNGAYCKVSIGDTSTIIAAGTTYVQQVPEFPTVALPVAAILGLVFIFGRRKEGL